MAKELGIAAWLLLLLTACSDPTFDATSEESRRESAARMREALPEAERAKFDQSVMVVAMNGVSLGDIATGAATPESAISSLDGKTATQIIGEADRIIALRQAKEREQALQEIVELEARLARAEADKAALAKFEVSRSRFGLHVDRYSIRAQPQIALSLKNGTDKAVARVFARGVLATPGRSVPWIDQEFNFSVAGGIEPGEEYQTVLEPNMFSDWGRVSPPADAVFTVEIIELEGADGKPIYSTRGLSEVDAARLAELKSKFDQIR